MSSISWPLHVKDVTTKVEIKKLEMEEAKRGNRNQAPVHQNRSVRRHETRNIVLALIAATILIIAFVLLTT